MKTILILLCLFIAGCCDCSETSYELITEYNMTGDNYTFFVTASPCDGTDSVCVIKNNMSDRCVLRIGGE